MWKQGYVSDVPYVHTVWPICSPAHLAFSALMNGVAPPDLRSFRYLELGCGHGTQLNLFASAYPEAAFYGLDFGPEHCASARRLADEAGLGNVTILERSFADLAETVAGSPRFDFIVLHGVYSWVSQENKDHILAIIREGLNPGGLVYVSYNALPGKLHWAGLQHFLLEFASRSAGPSIERALDGFQLAARVLEEKDGFFAGAAGLGSIIQGHRKQRPAYLTHEFLNRDWRALHFKEVHDDLARAGLRFGGETSFKSHVSVALPPDLLALSEASRNDVVWREMMRDYALNTGFRSDVFVRPGEVLDEARRAAAVRAQPLCLMTAGKNWPSRLSTPAGAFLADADTLAALREALKRGPQPIGDLEAAVGARADFETLLRILRLLVDSDALRPALVEADSGEAARRFNRVIMRDAPYGARSNHLASPVLGSAAVASHQDMLAFQAIEAHGLMPATELAATMEERLALGGAELVLDGQPLEPPERRAELARYALLFEARYWPVLRQFGLCEPAAEDLELSVAG